MSPYTLEVYRFDADRLLQVTSEYMHPLIGAVKAVSGINVGFFGQQFQDAKQLYLIQLWDSYEKHVELRTDSAHWAGVQEHIDVISSKQFSYHGAYDVDPTPALTAPVTEILKLTANEGVSRDDTLLPVLASTVELLRAISGVQGASFGPVLEDNKSVAFVCGWQSFDHFTKSTAQGSAAVREKIAQLKQIAAVELGHADLSSYKE
ncbi:hypothetical protein EUX98_g6284 [Antrodiella citrinella]|uniref:ABM domain-containing protein n=1 Tax=Antrodiella citrinella TaxID=2447956 RepID=A0A4V3XI68_9APHY|nr:hypothetical protein EUX98_g6284 [Antrodiella citrinella]